MVFPERSFLKISGFSLHSKNLNSIGILVLSRVYFGFLEWFFLRSLDSPLSRPIFSSRCLHLSSFPESCPLSELKSPTGRQVDWSKLR